MPQPSHQDSTASSLRPSGSPFCRWPHPAVLQAGRHQFVPGQRSSSPNVRSRFLFRCLAGKGMIRVNGQALGVSAGDFLFLPWGRSISYHPDDYSPMRISGAHVVPDYRPPDGRFAYGIPHADNDPGAFDPWYKDMNLGCLEGIVRGTFREQSRLNHLAEYLVHWYQAGERYEWQARNLAQLLLEELTFIVEKDRTSDRAFPPEMERAADYVRRHLDRSISVPGLALAAGCSPSTLTRMVRTRLSTSPMQWVLRQRMRKAAHLLSSTSLPVGAVGQRVGIDDPYYFSKVFRRYHGVTAREYRRKTALM